MGLVVNDTLSVAYTGGDRSWLAVIAYKQRPDGALEGKWAVQGPGREAWDGDGHPEVTSAEGDRPRDE